MKIRGCTWQKWEPVQAVLQIRSFSQLASISLHSLLSARHHAKDWEFSYQTHSISILKEGHAIEEGSNQAKQLFCYKAIQCSNREIKTELEQPRGSAPTSSQSRRGFWN